MALHVLFKRFELLHALISKMTCTFEVKGCGHPVYLECLVIVYNNGRSIKINLS